MKLVNIGVQVSTLATLATSIVGYRYQFSDAVRTTMPPIVDSNISTGLSTNQESRIYGGSEADVDKYPFIASLRFDPDGKTFCGGTLVAPQYILTAGHCIKTDKGQIYASLGSEFGSGAGSGSAEQIKVVEGYRHPLYNNTKHLYDVGLLKLKSPAAQKPVSVCAVDGSDNKVGTVATVLGWGVTEERKGSFTLQEVNVPIISNAECNKKYGNRITEGMMCAGDGNGKDSCNGDSGGPLLASNVLVGLVSWGGKCGSKAGVYTRLTYVMDYIKDVLNGDNDSLFTGSSTLETPQQEPLNSSLAMGSTDADEPRKPTTTEAPASEASLSVTYMPSTPSSSSGGLSMQSLSSGLAEDTEAPPTTDTTSGAPTNEAPTSGKSCVTRKRLPATM